MKTKILITGFSGFVARHFVWYLFKSGINADICGIDMKSPLFDYTNYVGLNIKYYKVNLLDYDKLHEVIDKFEPDYILHLASYSSVAYSWQNPTESFKNNTNIFLNLVSSVKDLNKDTRILSVGSSEEYGDVEEQELPLLENRILKPNSPYAVARVSQEMLARVYADSYQMNIILTRSFNHIGPYQDERFVVPGFIRRILNIYETGEKSGVIETGNITIVRDFVDVRDVVKAYWMLLRQGTSGQLYNICSGKGISLQKIINMISDYLGIDIRTKINPEYVRPSDSKIVIGSSDKIFRELGWKSNIPIEESLKDMIEIMKNKEYNI